MYASGPRLLLQGTLRKLVASPDGSQTWEYRHVAIFPTALHVYRAAGVPAEGSRPKTLIPLAGACVEVVHADDTGIHASAVRPFTFSLIPAGSLAETVMSAGGPAELERWIDECARAVYLAGHAAARGLTIVASTAEGLRLRNAAGTHVATAADVFAGVSSAAVNASVTSLARAGGVAGARPSSLPQATTTLRAPASSNRSLVGGGGMSSMSGGGGSVESAVLVSGGVSGTSPAAGIARRKEARVSPQSVDAPPAPPQRGGGVSGSVYTSGRAPSPGESMLTYQDGSTLPNMAANQHRSVKATDMPKPKSAQWAETGGVPAAAARGERERLAREAVVAAANAAPTRRGVKFADEPAGLPVAPLPTFGVGGGGEAVLGLPPTGDRPPSSYPQLGGSLVSLAVRSLRTAVHRALHFPTLLDDSLTATSLPPPKIKIPVSIRTAPADE